MPKMLQMVAVIPPRRAFPHPNGEKEKIFPKETTYQPRRMGLERINGDGEEWRRREIHQLSRESN
jgi:hypothetical protein